MTDIDIPAPLIFFDEITALRDHLEAVRPKDADIALVPTMGALHEGHLSLVRLAASGADYVVVSVFVNPLQFGAGEDLERYPRTLAEDLRQLAELAHELQLTELIVFAPTTQQMYPDAEPQTSVCAGIVSTMFEGASRPGHFDGMLTVVLKLLNIVEPTRAIFGQKDAQQLFLIRQMVCDFNLNIEIVGAPIVREEDGLALSSRNRYLEPEERQLSLALSQALTAVSLSKAETVSEKLEAGLEILSSSSQIKLDYLAAVHPDTFIPVAGDYTGEAVILVAAKVGQTRLIDNLVQEF